ncbi:MAG: phasin family protein [Rubellimicrobium sp.]|nr:phasin family protein [Rubellimicrobium sp.]
MAKTQDVNSMMKDAMSAFPVDSKAFETMFKSQSALAEKVSAVAIDAAQKSTEISHRWMQETLGKFATITTAKTEPADYAKSVGDFVQTSAQTAAEHMAAFAEIAKKAQSETVELMLAAGKTLSDDVSAAARKATTEVTSAARKAATVG